MLILECAYAYILTGFEGGGGYCNDPFCVRGRDSGFCICGGIHVYIYHYGYMRVYADNTVGFFFVYHRHHTLTWGGSAS